MEELNLKGHFWFRESTQEWVFEVVFQLPDLIYSIQRYPGKTKLEALECFQDLFSETFSENLDRIAESYPEDLVKL